MMGFRLPTDRPYFIAEIGPNHNRRLDLALEMVDMIAAAGADAVKFQTFQSASTVVAVGAPLAEYMKRSVGVPDQAELLESIRLSFDDFRELSQACHRRGITFLSTPFDIPSVQFLAELGVPLLKIPSGEITNSFLLKTAARSGLPLIVSTGMASMQEVGTAVDLLRKTWAEHNCTPVGEALILLHCTSAYPASAAAANLKAMQALQQEFGVPVGYSDHTLGRIVPVAAAALGARVIEKHVTLDTRMDGPDHAASLPLSELPNLLQEIREASIARGSGVKDLMPEENDVRLVARRSVAAARQIEAGEVFTTEALTALRPATGLPPSRAELLLGRRATRSYRVGELIEIVELDGGSQYNA